MYTVLPLIIQIKSLEKESKEHQARKPTGKNAKHGQLEVHVHLIITPLTILSLVQCVVHVIIPFLFSVHTGMV